MLSDAERLVLNLLMPEIALIDLGPSFQAHQEMLWSQVRMFLRHYILKGTTFVNNKKLRPLLEKYEFSSSRFHHILISFNFHFQSRQGFSQIMNLHGFGNWNYEVFLLLSSGSIDSGYTSAMYSVWLGILLSQIQSWRWNASLKHNPIRECLLPINALNFECSNPFKILELSKYQHFVSFVQVGFIEECISQLRSVEGTMF